MDIVLLVLRIALAALLYAFLGTAILFLWRDLRQAAAAQAKAVPGGRLLVVACSEENPVAGAVFALQPVTSIGRAPTNTIALADTYASAQHALLAWREGQWWLEDLGSRNGTLLNGEPITVPTVVSSGDVVSIGQTQFRLELDYGPGTAR